MREVGSGRLSVKPRVRAWWRIREQFRLSQIAMVSDSLMAEFFQDDGRSVEMGEKFKVKVNSSKCYTEKGDRGHPKYKTVVECADPNLIQNCRKPHFPDFAFDSPVAYTPGDEYDLVLRKPEVDHAAGALSYAEAFFPGKKPKIENQFLSPPGFNPPATYSVMHAEIRNLEAGISLLKVDLMKAQNKLADRGETIASQRIKIEGLTNQVASVMGERTRKLQGQAKVIIGQGVTIGNQRREILELKGTRAGTSPALLRKVQNLELSNAASEEELSKLRAILVANQVCPSDGQIVNDEGSPYCLTLDEARGDINDLEAQLRDLGEARGNEAKFSSKPHLMFKIEELEATIKHKDETIRLAKGQLEDEQMKTAALDEKLALIDNTGTVLRLEGEIAHLRRQTKTAKKYLDTL